MIFPHLRWFLNEEGWPYLYRYDSQRKAFPNDPHTAYNTLAEACKAGGLDLEDVVRQL